MRRQITVILISKNKKNTTDSDDCSNKLIQPTNCFDLTSKPMLNRPYIKNQTSILPLKMSFRAYSS